MCALACGLLLVLDDHHCGASCDESSNAMYDMHDNFEASKVADRISDSLQISLRCTVVFALWPRSSLCNCLAARARLIFGEIVYS